MGWRYYIDAHYRTSSTLCGGRFFVGGVFAKGLIFQQSALIDGVLFTVPRLEPGPAKQNYPPKQVLHEDPIFKPA